MIPLIAMASLLAGAAYFGLPDQAEDSTGDAQDRGPADPQPDLSDGGLLADMDPGPHMAEPLTWAEGSSEGLTVVTGSAAGAVTGEGHTLAGPQPDARTAGDAPSVDTVVQTVSVTQADTPSTAMPPPPTVTHHLTGTAAGEVLRAGGPSTVTGLGGNDTLLGGAQADHLIGGAGDDLLQGGGGSNLLQGGAGSDLLLGVESHRDPATGLHNLLTPAGGPTIDRLEGGAGDDVLRMGHGDTGAGGMGADLFFVQADDGPEDVAVPRIEDFDRDHDRLVLAVPFTEAQIIAAWPETPEHDALVEVRDFEDGTGATILVDGEAVAEVVGAQGLDPSAIRLTGSDMVGPDLCDIADMSAKDSYWGGAHADPTVRAFMDAPTG